MTSFEFSPKNFKDIPDEISQMYSIHATTFGVTFPFAYALLKNKRKATYVKLFTKLKEIQVL